MATTTTTIPGPSSLRLGKCFLVRSQQSADFVLEVEDGVDRPGVVVCTGEPCTENNDHQLWFVDQLTGTIRTRLNQFCLDLTDDTVVVNPYVRGRTEQQWRVDGDVIRNKDNAGVTLGLTDSTPERRTTCKAQRQEGHDAHWNIKHQPALYFYIRRYDEPRQVLDIRGGDRKPGADVMVYGDKGDLADNQLWYEDITGIVRSKLNGFALDATGKHVVMLPYDSTSTRQLWTLDGNTLVSRLDNKHVLELKPSTLLSNPSLFMAEYRTDHSNPHQLWIFDYIPRQATSLSHSGCGKHFVIRSRLNGFVLQVADQTSAQGATVTTDIRNSEPAVAARQQFYTDDATGSIRNLMRNHCLDVDDSKLVVRSYDPNKKNQQWRLCGNKIQNRHNLNLVLALAEDSTTAGTNIIIEEYTGADRQHWEISHVPARCFFVISQMCDKVMDVKSDDSSAGASVILYDRKPLPQAANQLWYEDERGVIRSKLNGYVLDSSGSEVKLRPHDPSNRQQHWILVGDRIQNKYDNKLVLDIRGGTARNGATICEYHFHGGANQRWTFEFVSSR